MKTGATVNASVAGSILQVAMVVIGHYYSPVKSAFAIGGMGLSLLAGLLYAYLAKEGWAGALIGGTVAGGLCALVGIAISCALGDAPASLMIFGTAGSAVAGLAGGAVGKLFIGSISGGSQAATTQNS
jgi:hypothetical protein